MPFADVANIIVTGNDIDELQSTVSSLQSLLDEWVRNNGLKLNMKKIKFMIFTNINIDISGIEVILDYTKIKIIDEQRFLGLMMNIKLIWKTHKYQQQKKPLKFQEMQEFCTS